MYQLIEEKVIQKAKKRYKCECCLQPIEIGTPYHREFSVYDGPQIFKMHVACREFFLEWHSEQGEEEFSMWELNEAWELSQEAKGE